MDQWEARPNRWWSRFGWWRYNGSVDAVPLAVDGARRIATFPPYGTARSWSQGSTGRGVLLLEVEPLVLGNSLPVTHDCAYKLPRAR